MPSHNGKYYWKNHQNQITVIASLLNLSFLKRTTNIGSSSSSSPLDENSNNESADTNLQNENDGATVNRMPSRTYFCPKNYSSSSPPNEISNSNSDQLYLATTTLT